MTPPLLPSIDMVTAWGTRSMGPPTKAPRWGASLLPLSGGLTRQSWGWMRGQW